LDDEQVFELDLESDEETLSGTTQVIPRKCDAPKLLLKKNQELQSLGSVLVD